MIKFQKLSQINKDINLLENKGDFKAATILHVKFIKESQKITYKPTTQDDTPQGKENPEPQDEFKGVREYSELLSDIQFNADNSLFDKYYQEYINNQYSYPKTEQGYLKAGVDRILRQRRRDGIVDPKVVEQTKYTPGKVENIESDFQSKEWKKYNPKGYVIDSPVENFNEGLARFNPQSDVNLGLKNNTFEENAKEFDKEMTRVIASYSSSSPKNNDFNYAESILNVMQSQIDSMSEESKEHATKTYEDLKTWMNNTISRHPVTENNSNNHTKSNSSQIDKLEDRVFKYKNRILKFRYDRPKLKKLKGYIKQEWDDERLDDKSYYDLIELIKSYDN
jgi:hypothetical protein